MRKLLSANFLRLRKSRLFWSIVGISFLMGIVFVLQSFLDKVRYERAGYLFSFSLDRVFFRYTLLAAIAMAVFVPMFFGTDYSDGAIRNKLIVGHSRLSIYLANLITAAAAAFIFCAAYMLAVLAAGVPLLQWFGISVKVFLSFLGGTLMVTTAFSALYTLIAMAFSRKAAASVVCVMMAFALLLSAFIVYTKLEAAEYIESNYAIFVDGQLQESDPVPNPAYLRGTKRQVYQFLYDFNPGGQVIHYTNMAKDNHMRLAVYSLVIVVISTGAGGVIFRRKDLK